MTSELYRLSDDRRGRTAAAQPPRIRQATLPTAGRSPGVAREVAQDALTSWHLTHLTDTAVLLISELVTNAVLHAKADDSGLALSLEVRGKRLRAEAARTVRARRVGIRVRPGELAGRQLGGAEDRSRQGGLGGTRHQPRSRA